MVRRGRKYTEYGFEDETTTLQTLASWTKSPVFLGGMVCFSIFMFTTDTSALLGSRFLGQGETHFQGVLPNSLLTLDYPFTLLRDVVLEQPVHPSDVPFIWHPHRSDERIVQATLTNCYGVEVVELDSTDSIKKAQQVKLASRNAKNFVITSPFLSEAIKIFSVENMGRMSCFFRHPLDYDAHHALPDEFDEPDNWLLRYMIGEPKMSLSYKELGTAKLIIRKTCVVATIDKMERSIERIASYYGWELQGSDSCVADIVAAHNPKENYEDHESERWRSFYEKNKFDCQLYELAQSQWRGQIQTIIPHHLQVARQRGISGEVDEQDSSDDPSSRKLRLR